MVEVVDFRGSLSVYLIGAQVLSEVVIANFLLVVCDVSSATFCGVGFCCEVFLEDCLTCGATSLSVLLAEVCCRDLPRLLSVSGLGYMEDIINTAYNMYKLWPSCFRIVSDNT